MALVYLSALFIGSFIGIAYVKFTVWLFRDLGNFIDKGKEKE